MKLYFVVANFCNNKGRFFQIYGISYGIRRCGRVAVWQLKFCGTVHFWYGYCGICLLVRCGNARDILLCFGIREVPQNMDVLPFMSIVDGGTIIAKAIVFVCAIYITPCNLFSFRYGPVFQFFIKSVLKVMVDHHLIPVRVLCGENRVGFIHNLPVEPVVELGRAEIQLHKLHIVIIQNCPSNSFVTFCVSVFDSGVFTGILVWYISENRIPDNGIELVIDFTDSQGGLLFGIGQKAILFDKLGNAPLHLGPCQSNRSICTAFGYIQRLFRFRTVFFGKPFCGTAFPAMFLHIADYGQLAFAVSVP